MLDSSLHVLSQRETEICVSGQVMGEVEKQDSLGSNSRSVFELEFRALITDCTNCLLLWQQKSTEVNVGIALPL